MTDDPFADFNQGIRRARRDYEAHPFAEWQGVARDCLCRRCVHKREYLRKWMNDQRKAS